MNSIKQQDTNKHTKIGSICYTNDDIAEKENHVRNPIPKR
jgi:hypothetical protein